MAIADTRRDYGMAGLLEKDRATDPFPQFPRWFREAETDKMCEPDVVTLGTARSDGQPSVRKGAKRMALW